MLININTGIKALLELIVNGFISLDLNLNRRNVSCLPIVLTVILKVDWRRGMALKGRASRNKIVQRIKGKWVK